MFVHARPGAASYAACQRLFLSYPLAVNWLHPVGAGAGAGWRRSILLRHRAAGETRCHVLTQDPDDDFALWTWQPRCQLVRCQPVRPGQPVPAATHAVLTEAMPVPREGALLGWVSDRQATAVMTMCHGRPGDAGGPQLRVLALDGSDPLDWPPFSTSPLDDGRLWEYLDQGQIVDLAPVIGRSASGAFWVPSQNPARAERGHGCVVVRRPLATEDYWVPAGVYMDHWMLREQVPAPPPGHLVTLPGTVDLALGA